MDKIFYNGKIYSLDANNTQYSAIGVRNGKIEFLGGDAEAASLPAKERVNLSGKTMLPGFIDSHLHMLNYAFGAKSYNTLRPAMVLSQKRVFTRFCVFYQMKCKFK